MEKTIIVKQINVQTGEEIEVEEVIEINKEAVESERIAQSNVNAINTLNSTDWKVIRELERKLLAGTDLNLEREALRESIVC